MNGFAHRKPRRSSAIEILESRRKKITNRSLILVFKFRGYNLLCFIIDKQNARFQSPSIIRNVIESSRTILTKRILEPPRAGFLKRFEIMEHQTITFLKRADTKHGDKQQH